MSERRSRRKKVEKSLISFKKKIIIETTNKGSLSFDIVKWRSSRSRTVLCLLEEAKHLAKIQLLLDTDE